MKVAIPKERRADERRVAASPETVKKMIGLGLEVTVEAGAGLAASITDSAYSEAGATIAKTAKEALTAAQIVLKVSRPLDKSEGEDEFALLPKGAVLISGFDPFRAGAGLNRAAEAGVTAFAMELMPRITRAQSMDILSSQANLAGYKAVLDGTEVFTRAFPMMMTAAGKISPANVFVMGAGVAGLQAIATARRLGAVVSATDVRPAAKEQVESLGAKFIAVEDEEFKQAETAGGYAKEMSDAYKKKQAALVAETLKKQDMVITTALIPGRPAPKLVTEEMVKSMKTGSVIVDLAGDNGGNCELSEPGTVVQKHGVTILAHRNVPSRLARDASELFARNLFNFLQLMIDKESKSLKLDWEDELIKATCITHGGKIVHEGLKEIAGKTGRPASKKPAARKAKPSSGAKAAASGSAKKAPAVKKPAQSDKQKS
ncbi:NAD(P) transhydrogenase subunit alpha [Limibacillus sp. MBR-115]|jgi:NAD(P) transhydrogenase subunit alpha